MKPNLFARLIFLFVAIWITNVGYAQVQLTVTNNHECDFDVDFYTLAKNSNDCNDCILSSSGQVSANGGTIEYTPATARKICRLRASPVSSASQCSVWVDDPCTGVTDCGQTSGCPPLAPFGDWGLHLLSNSAAEIDADSN